MHVDHRYVKHWLANTRRAAVQRDDRQRIWRSMLLFVVGVQIRCLLYTRKRFKIAISVGIPSYPLILFRAPIRVFLIIYLVFLDCHL